jgi:cytochrome o ubiquinol oxidase subunit I
VFTPMYWLGLEGMTRRLQRIEVSEWQPFLVVMVAGVAVMMAGMAAQVIQLVVSIRRRQSLRDETGDPWEGRSLEWSTASPPPPYNFAVLPDVRDEQPYWTIKQRAERQQAEGPPTYEPIEMPRHSPTGFVTAFFATAIGFALIWHIWWLAITGLVGAYTTFVAFAWRDRADDEISAEDVERLDDKHRQTMRRTAEQSA